MRLNTQNLLELGMAAFCLLFFIETGDAAPVDFDVDEDDDGLIEIDNLDMLDHVRYNLEGRSYKTGPDDEGNRSGAPSFEPENCNDGDETSTVTLCGYELTRNLDFARAADYASGELNSAWRPNNSDPGRATNAGFPGLGAEKGREGGFSAIFEGNGYSITNLYSRNITREGRNSALFNLLGAGIIRNIELSNVAVYGGAGDEDSVGGLVGVNRGTIVRSFVSGHVNGGRGNEDRVGILVGTNEGILSGSQASGTPSGGGGRNDFVGFLIGWNQGTIMGGQ